MNFDEIKNAVEYLQENTTCPACESNFTSEDIHVIATTKQEGLFEIKCPHCRASSIMNVMVTPDLNVTTSNQAPRLHRKITQDDVLDVKNTLNNFDGNFKKLFEKKPKK